VDFYHCIGPFILKFNLNLNRSFLFYLLLNFIIRLISNFSQIGYLIHLDLETHDIVVHRGEWIVLIHLHCIIILKYITEPHIFHNFTVYCSRLSKHRLNPFKY